jgi:hypothetical protein
VAPAREWRAGDLAVTPGETLYLDLGGNGTELGGFNGGGDGGAGARAGRAGGGGATDIRTIPSGDPGSLASRVFVAGGGGGGGGWVASGGTGGDAGSDGQGAAGGVLAPLAVAVKNPLLPTVKVVWPSDECYTLRLTAVNAAGESPVASTQVTPHS